MKSEARSATNVPLGVMGTAMVHGAALVALLTSAAGAHSSPPVYRVRLIAAPEVGQETRKAPEAVQREAAPPAPAPPTKRPPPSNTVSKAVPPPVSDTRNREAAPRTSSAAKPLPGETPSTGNDVATVSTAGIEFPYPEYLQNIVSQVLQRWQRPLADTPLEAEVSFMVHRDGSITDLQFVKRSNNYPFDLEAQGAVEEAGRFRAFGPLPDGWVADVLFVRFYFSGKRQ